MLFSSLSDHVNAILNAVRDGSGEKYILCIYTNKKRIIKGKLIIHCRIVKLTKTKPEN